MNVPKMLKRMARASPVRLRRERTYLLSERVERETCLRYNGNVFVLEDKIGGRSYKS